MSSESVIQGIPGQVSSVDPQDRPRVLIPQTERRNFNATVPIPVECQLSAHTYSYILSAPKPRMSPRVYRSSTGRGDLGVRHYVPSPSRRVNPTGRCVSGSHGRLILL